MVYRSFQFLVFEVRDVSEVTTCNNLTLLNVIVLGSWYVVQIVCILLVSLILYLRIHFFSFDFSGITDCGSQAFITMLIFASWRSALPIIVSKKSLTV